MKRLPVILFALALVGGCMTPPAPPKQLPVAASSSFDAAWDATRAVVEQHFDLYVQRKDAGYMMSDYKRGEPLPGDLKGDAQTHYDKVEELLHVVRRQLTVRILEDSPGVFVVHLEVIREREGYQPPEPQIGTGAPDLYDASNGGTPKAPPPQSVTWYRLGRDLFLEKKLLEDIRSRLASKGLAVEVAPSPMDNATH
jgi:hypothetical protein